MGPMDFGVNRMSPLDPQLPPRPSSASQRTSTEPVESSMRRSFAREKKTRNRPSGDQKGLSAVSVPGSARTSSESRSRTRSIILPPAIPPKTSLRPSGEISKESVSSVRCGGRIVRSIGSVTACRGRREVKAMPAATSVASAATAQGSQGRVRGGTVVVTTPDEGPSPIQPSSRLTSAALCQRSSGSLARHVWTIRSSAGGDMG